jgi:hypothetical protein
MGYSGRYHAASLVAVFIALAIGIVIGAGLADDVQTSADKEVEDTLRSDLDDAEQRADDLDADLEREQEFSSRAYPALVDGRLAGESVAIIGIGDLDDQTAAAVESALAPTGAEVAARATIATPADVEALVDAAGPRWAAARRDNGELERLGRRLGGSLTGGSGLIDKTGSELFSRFSGKLNDVSRVVVVPSDLGDLEAGERESTASLLAGVYSGVEAGAPGSAAVELSATDPSELGEASAAGISTVDDADLTAGKVALVFSLLGADGDFGIKDGVDSFLPDLVGPVGSSGP